MKDPRFVRLQQDSNIDQEYKKHFKEFDLIVDTASQLWLEGENPSQIGKGFPKNKNITAETQAAVVRLLPPLLQTQYSEPDNANSLINVDNLSHKELLKTKVLWEKDLDLYVKLDKLKSTNNYESIMQAVTGGGERNIVDKNLIGFWDQ